MPKNGPKNKMCGQLETNIFSPLRILFIENIH